MAIEKYYFNQASVTANAEDVKQFIESSGYFDSVELDVTTSTYFPTVICSVGNASLKFTISGGDTTSGAVFYLVTESGFVYDGTNRYYTAGFSNKSSYGIKTEYGLFIYYNSTHHIFITKSDKDTVAINATWRYGTSGNSSSSVETRYCRCDLINSKSTSGTDLTTKSMSAALTTLVPLVLPSACYTPNLYFMPFSQYVGIVGILEIDGIKYFSDGYCCLKE